MRLKKKIISYKYSHVREYVIKVAQTNRVHHHRSLLPLTISKPINTVVATHCAVTAATPFKMVGMMMMKQIVMATQSERLSACGMRKKRLNERVCFLETNTQGPIWECFTFEIKMCDGC